MEEIKKSEEQIEVIEKTIFQKIVSLEIKDEETLTEAVEIGRDIKIQKEKIEKVKKYFNDIKNKMVEAIKRLDKFEYNLKEMIAKYQEAQKQEREKQEAEQREKQEKEYNEAVQTAVSKGESPPPPPEQIETKKEENKDVQIRKSLNYEIIEPEKVPEEIAGVKIKKQVISYDFDKKAIRKLINAGVQIPGIKVTEKIGVAITQDKGNDI